MSRPDIGEPTGFTKISGAGDTENLTELENLNEETLLAELKTRYFKDTIYTYVGEILVAMNPFMTIPGLYDLKKQIEYCDIGDRSIKPPHLFAVADVAFTSMGQNKSGKAANQVCVISGESGAGKTESAKLFMKQIIYLSQRLGSSEDTAADSKGLEEKIIQLNPLLEAFGNAQTLMNDNSSRFGKFVELRFDPQLRVQGAIMSEYLLEKSRIVNQGDGEQNFHVFYLFFAGLSGDDKEKYQLSDPGEHRYINSSDEALGKIETKQCKDMWKELRECIDIVGLPPAEVDDLFHLLAGVLHTGDVEFAGDDAAYIVSADDVLGKVANQFGADVETLSEALTQSSHMTRGELIVRAYKSYEAEDCRDAMAKALYGRAFSWIFSRVNKLLGPKNAKMRAGEKTIGILDIFGFECFDTNSFEQLLINLANEQLQFFFNNHIFAMELEEYAREGIDGSKISFEDNQPLLDLLLRKTQPIGLLAICDEEALFPKGSDQTMVEKFHQNFASAKHYTKPRGDEPQFTIHHYAGSVEYEVEGFLEKNRDTLALDVVAALRLSERPLIKSLFDDEPVPKKGGKDKKPMNAKDKKKNLRKSMKHVAKAQKGTSKTTVGGAFKSSLAQLMATMSEASPHFIRCIKPNLNKASHDHDDEMVTKQLRYTGMLETTRIRKEGYSHRPTFADFVNRYKILAYNYTSNPPPAPATCQKICAKAGIDGWQVGKTKVFLRYYHADALAKALVPYPTNAITLQKAARGCLARLQHRKMVEAARQQAKDVETFIRRLEKTLDDTLLVMDALADEDSQRPPDYFEKKAQMKTEEPLMKKFAKKQAKSIKKAGGVSRAASVKWFKEVEMKKGAAMSATGGFEEWFHGIITRKQAEAVLSNKPAGSFLVRVAESRFGYSLSHSITSGGRIKHYMIDQTPDGQYQVIGNSKLFPSLNALVGYHSEHKIVAGDPVCLEHPCGQQGDEDDTEEFLDKKKRKGRK